jgi:hypothetical protein
MSVEGSCCRARAAWPTAAALLAGLVAVTAAGCDDSSSESPTSVTTLAALAAPPPPPPGWGAGSNRIEGEVFDFRSGAIAGATVTLVGETPTDPYLSWRLLPDAPFKSDGVGHFVATKLPEATVHVSAWKPGFVQPCAVRVDSRAGTRVTVELVPESSLDNDHPPRPQLSVEPALTGFVYEMTPLGRTPVAGARLLVAHHLDIWGDDGLAATVSDRRGAFFLCNLPRRANLWVTRSGFVTLDQLAIDGTQSTPLEIELRRR